MAILLLLTVQVFGGPARAEDGNGAAPLDPKTLRVERLGVSDEPSAPAEEAAPFGPDEPVRVTIVLEGKSASERGFDLRSPAGRRAAADCRTRLKNEQQALTARIEKAVGHRLNVKWNLTLLLNAISVELPYRDVARIERMKGVRSVELETQYAPPCDAEPAQPDSAATVNMIGASSAWDLGYTGAGSRIAIIDTGIDTEHQSFDAAGFEYGLNETAQETGRTYTLMTNAFPTGLNVPGVYVSSKIPFAYNYIDHNTTVDHLSDTMGDHGSHVAGIAAANRYVPYNGGYGLCAPLYKAVGMAPDAQLCIMKVFGAAGGAYDSDYMAAIEDALALGCDACNLSLGSSEQGFTYDNVYQTVLNRLSDPTENPWMVVAIAAGNSYALTDRMEGSVGTNGLYAGDVGLHTGGAPGTYVNSLCVASSGKASVGQTETAAISNFSSWGVPGSLLMKPEITAPGGSILSVYGRYNSGSGMLGGPNKYTRMSGTSMATPHISGLAAILAQYFRENPIGNSALTQRCSVRAIVQSLLMSTATPLVTSSGEYRPILQQGAGLADAEKAISASSVVMMDPQHSYLTGLTGAAADGKVKVELGDDPARTGVYTYRFDLFNLSDHALDFTFDTDLFTQDVAQQSDGLHLCKTTRSIRAAAAYTVAIDGISVQVGAQGTDLTPDSVETAAVPAFGKATVTVQITLNPDDLDAVRCPNGAYIEGFTYARCGTEGSAHTHSIPILGFYGSWTDPSMFDAASYLDGLYPENGTAKASYTGNPDTNYLRVTQNGETVRFSGNPYAVENAFPADRLAIRSDTVLTDVVYSLYRAAGTTAFAVTRTDGIGGDNIAVPYASGLGNNVEGIYYDSQEGWQNLSPKTYTINKTAAQMGFSEGDTLCAGFYAVPEYYAMTQKQSYTAADSGRLDLNGFRALLLSNRLGRGAFVGCDFTVDDTAPVIEAPSFSGSTLTFSASDDRHLAYVAVLSPDNTVCYAEFTPGTAAFSVSVDISAAIASGDACVVLFAGDYAGNECAVSRSVPAPSFKKHQMFLSDQIGVRFYADLSMLSETDRANANVTFAITGKGAGEMDPTPVALDPNKTNGSGYYGFDCLVNSIQMADTITAALHYGNNQTVTDSYSVRTYVQAWDDAYPTDTSKVTTLIHALADFGHYVQPFLATVNGFTVGTDYAAMDQFYAQSYNVEAIRTAAAAYRKTVEGSDVFKAPSTSLVLDSKTAIRVFLAHADDTKLDLNNVQITVTPQSGIAWPTDQWTATQSGNRILVEIRDVKASWLDKSFTVTVTEGGNTQTVTLSALSYVEPFLTAYNGNTAAQNAICAFCQYAMAAIGF